MFHGDRTALMAMRMVQAAELEKLNALRQELNDISLLLRWRREVKYSPEQPRDELGRWTSGGGGEGDPPSDGSGSDVGEAFGIAPDGTMVELTGTSGFSDEQERMTVQAFRSAYCQGNIREVLPSELNPFTILEVITLAKDGNAAARRCLKLLGEPRFRK